MTRETEVRFFFLVLTPTYSTLGTVRFLTQLQGNYHEKIRLHCKLPRSRNKGCMFRTQARWK